MQTFDSADKNYMRMALNLAEKNIGMSSPNPSVGCVVVRNGKIVGRGWHEYDRMNHAEVQALAMAGDKSENATVYVTLEPCCHQGRTPPCTELLVRKGVRRVVVAHEDPNPRVSGGGIARLRSKGIRVDVGLLYGPAGQVIEAFACKMTTGRPLVLSKVGMSLDGKIGSGRKKGIRISSSGGLKHGQSLRLRSDAVLVGIGTLLSDDPRLNYRGAGTRRRPLMKVVLDSSLRTPIDAGVFSENTDNTVLIFCRQGNSTVRRRNLEKKGAEIVVVPTCDDFLDLDAILEDLAKRDVQGLLVEGGSRVHWEFISQKLVDRFDFIVAPLVLGGDQAVPSVGGEGYTATVDAPKFKIRRRYSAGTDLILEAYPSYSRSVISPWRAP
ncbi:MAG: bifunctional diaminohydroxyphosphoribosylaminopyrimidine deaminase/5-amino-6-(5-phosphoribosylamino)uracil reductase RibD [Acidobacteriota bacterium]